MNLNMKLLSAVFSGLVALFLAIAGAYASLDRRVEAKPSTADVRQIVEDKTRDRLDEVLRRQEHMDKQLDRLGEAIMRLDPRLEQK